MSHFDVSEARLKQIHEIVEPSANGDVFDYELRLKTETDKDDSLQAYLDWVLKEDAIDPAVQSPSVWLQNLCSIDFHDAWAVIDIRTSLSFGEMNYLHLGHSERFDEYYIVISDTTALRRSQPDPDLSGVSKLADTHPAMLQLSFGNAVHSEQSPRIVLVIGRIVRIMRFSFLPDHELHSALLAAWELSKLDKPENHEALDEIVHKTSVFLGIETKAGTDPTDFQVCYGDYLMEIARGLAAGLDIQKVLQQPSTEKARRDRWEHILRQSRGHEFTGFVAAVDAAGPTHRICAIHQCDRDVIRSADVGTSPTGGPVNLFEMNSGDPFTIYEGQDSTTYIMCVKEWASGNQMDSMDLYSRIKDGMACGRLLVRPVTVTELQRYLADHKNDSDETVRAGTQDLPTREIY